ncbi:MAG: hypothetical protein LBD53_09810 [Tannerella sp.]|jgi:hypothetical protein|nr:hypothetical protein [Tannerella sp.]
MDSLLEKTELARQKGRYWRRVRNILTGVLISCLLIWGSITYYYPVKKGVKAGKLNQVVYKGFIFKTYEGKLLPDSTCLIANEAKIQTSDFVFTVANKAIAEQLMRTGDKTVELHYTEYFKSIPWRGSSKYVVNKIEKICSE